MELAELDKISYDFVAVMKNHKLSIKEALYVLEVCRLDVIRADADLRNPFSTINLSKAGFGKDKLDKKDELNVKEVK